ncbi:MAG TPA: hypothetical protein VHO03_18630 [Ignavibacteriales bacterium]|nr:hypothetical protein [Ignavibacteriales bacterium]
MINKKKLTIVGIFLFLVLSSVNVQVSSSNQIHSNTDLSGLKISSSVPTASACWEIYCWGCETDICGNKSGFVCCWDTNIDVIKGDCR